MADDIEKIYAKLIAHESEIMNLRQGYMIVNERYTQALHSLKELTDTAAHAAKQACIAAEQATISTRKCAEAAKKAADQQVIDAAEAAATKRATLAAAEAVKLSNLAAESARTAKRK